MTKNKDFVIGFRQMKTDLNHPYFYFREMAVNLLTGLMNILYSTSIKDCACCYRLLLPSCGNHLKVMPINLSMTLV